MKTSIARPQYQLTASDLEALLALTRGGTLAEASARLQADASTVFRTVQRVEKKLGQRLFERSRNGYLATDTMLEIARHAERIESELEAARAAAAGSQTEITGRVRITTTDSVLRGLVLPVLAPLAREHPRLQLEVTSTNELMSLTRRDADIVGVADAIGNGLGIGIVPLFMLARERGLVALSEPLEGCESQLWLLAHPESRHLRRIAAAYQHLARTIHLPDKLPA